MTAGARGFALAPLVLLACCGRSPPAVEPLPGASPFDPSLRARIARALAAERSGMRPRTRHLRPDGSPRYTNRLVLESSPYLLQHAHNPVDWYPWGDEAFARAAAEGRPVLLSVGYATCHWCHVMEEESFDDEEVAEYLNRNYVAIKVDREVRPDVDDAYMGVVQALTGGGGWPMTVWLTPTREAFAGATYLPRAGFLSALREMRQAFDAEPLRVAAQASELTRRAVLATAVPPGDTLPDAGALHAAFRVLDRAFDATNGGFGRAPKFPEPAALDFLLRYHRRTGSPRALLMVVRTLEQMADGGIHDHVGGGFHRYATDAAWRVPHFEKTLADNAQLAAVYLAAWQVTKRDDFVAVVRDVLDWLARDMGAPEGGFYSATDADSGGEEGAFFVWTPGDVRAALDAEHAAAVIARYGVRGRTILHVDAPLAGTAATLGIDPARLRQLLDEARPALRAARARRTLPDTDRKIVTAWNGLAISAFARAGAVLGDPGYVERASKAARLVLERVRVNGRLRRTPAGGEAFLDDYACVVAGLLDLYEATFDIRWLEEAIALQDVVERDFRDAEGGGFFQVAAGSEAPLARRKPDTDGALPSGNAVATENLLRLAELTGDGRRRDEADRVLRALSGRLLRTPAAVPALAAALEFRLDRAKEIVIVEPEPGTGGRLLATVRDTYVPNHVLTLVTDVPGAMLARRVPLAADKTAIDGRPTAYVCEHGLCRRPTSDAGVLAGQLAIVEPL